MNQRLILLRELKGLSELNAGGILELEIHLLIVSVSIFDLRHGVVEELLVEKLVIMDNRSEVIHQKM